MTNVNLSYFWVEMMAIHWNIEPKAFRSPRAKSSKPKTDKSSVLKQPKQVWSGLVWSIIRDITNTTTSSGSSSSSSRPSMSMLFHPNP